MHGRSIFERSEDEDQWLQLHISTNKRAGDKTLPDKCKIKSVWVGAHVDDVVVALEILRQGLRVGLPVHSLCVFAHDGEIEHHDADTGCAAE